MNFLSALTPEVASTVAPHIDALMGALLLICVLILVIVFGLIFFFSIRYRKGSPHSRVISEKGQEILEWGWTSASLIIFMGIFIWSSLIYFKLHVAPSGSTEISVVGKQWMWKFQHPEGKREINELHIPVGVPILLKMTSQDVIHSFFVPAFRIKQDVLPGRYTEVWFEATKTGEFHLFCAQYCGTAHADMIGRIVAMSKDSYQRWLETGLGGRVGASFEVMASRGTRLFTRLGCISCHNEQPGAKAPTLYGLYGSTVGLSDGTSVVADENYLRESILNPNAKIVQGYPAIMPSFTGAVSEEDLFDLIAYIKSLKGSPPSAMPEGP